MRQLYYRLVAQAVLANNRATYKAFSVQTTNARRDGLIGYEQIEDSGRGIFGQSGHGYLSPHDYLARLRVCAGHGYVRDWWEEQENYVEAWVEKDALARIFTNACNPYRVQVNVGRGFSSASAVWKLGNRLRDERKRTGRTPIILYWGDFDPSGEDMVRDLDRRLREDHSVKADIRKIALTYEQSLTLITRPDPPKESDRRTAAFKARYGEDVNVVELDAIAPDDLLDQIRAALESVLDIDALLAIQQTEAREGDALRKALIAAYDSINLDDWLGPDGDGDKER